MNRLERAINAAAGMLGRRMLTCRELYDKLCKKGYDKEIAEQVVEKFLAAGYLDDRQYAKMYLTDGVNLSAKGIYRIRQELLQKGIALALIDEALEETDVNIEDALYQYVEERRLCENIHSRKDLEKLKARLVRRGYSLGEIRKCLDRYTFTLEDEEF